jgi:prephenate dehydratase
MSFKIDEKIASESQTPAIAGEILELPGTIDSVLHKRVMLVLDAVVLICFCVIYLLANLDRNNLVRSSPTFLPQAQQALKDYADVITNRETRTSWAFQRILASRATNLGMLLPVCSYRIFLQIDDTDHTTV